MPLSPYERSIRARIGAHRLHASHDTRVVSAPGRAAANAGLDLRLLREIDEHEVDLPEAERDRRLGHARRAHFEQLSFFAAKARRKKAARNG